jgi:hypothetical protein
MRQLRLENGWEMPSISTFGQHGAQRDLDPFLAAK